MSGRPGGWLRGGVLAAVVLALAACDNPVTPHERRDAIGARIYAWEGGQTGALLTETTANQSGWTQPLALTAGVPREVAVRFIAPDNTEFTLTETGEYTLRWVIANTAIARYDGAGNHGTLVPLAAGSTTAEVQVFHGSHSDWRSPSNLSVQVAAAP
jgi:hypothetical protein